MCSLYTLRYIPGEHVAACCSLGSNDMLMMDACEVEYQVGAGRWGSGGCRALAVGKALTVRPPACSYSHPGYSDWLEAKVSLAGLKTVHSRVITHS